MGFLLFDYILYFAILASRSMREGRTATWPVVAVTFPSMPPSLTACIRKSRLFIHMISEESITLAATPYCFSEGPRRGDSRNNF
jgi:hypothetical protein